MDGRLTGGGMNMRPEKATSDVWYTDRDTVLTPIVLQRLPVLLP